MVTDSQSMRRAHAVGRVLWRLGSQHRAVRGGVAAAKSVGKATARATRILLLEIAGFFFAVFAVMGLGAAWRQWDRIRTGQSSAPMSHVAIALAFSGVFLYFAASSFWRA